MPWKHKQGGGQDTAPHILNPQLKLGMRGELHIFATLLPANKLLVLTRQPIGWGPQPASELWKK